MPFTPLPPKHFNIVSFAFIFCVETLSRELSFPSTRWISYGLSWKTCSSSRRTLTLLSIEGFKRRIFILGGNPPNSKTAKYEAAKQRDECMYIHRPLTIRWFILLKRLNIFFFHSVVVYVSANFIFGLKCSYHVWWSHFQV